MNNKNKKKKRFKIYTYKSIQHDLDEINATFTIQEMLLSYLILIASSIALGLFFKLKIGYMLITIISAFLVAPVFFIDAKKKNKEKQKFNDINSYMSLMSQSYGSTKNILAALTETENKFKDSLIKTRIMEAIEEIRHSSNVRDSEATALEHIEKDFACKKLSAFHGFLLKSRTKGGNISDELRLLEDVKTEWKRATEKYRAEKNANTKLAYIEAFILIGVCAFIANKIPASMAIIQNPVVQISNAFLISMFLFIFAKMDKSLASSWLEPPKEMDEEEAKKAFNAVDNFNKKECLMRGIPLAVIFAVLFGAIYLFAQKNAIIVIGSIITLIVLNIYFIIYIVYSCMLKEELSYSFSEWIFNVLLLLQYENVNVAIFKTVESAPPVLKHELKKLEREIEEKADNAEAYLNFLGKYNVPGVEETMRMLFAISQGSGTDKNISVIAETNMKQLEETEKRKLEAKGASTNMFFYLPILPCVFVIIVYAGVLMLNIFTSTLNMLN